MKILFDTHSVDLKLTGIGRYWKNLINRLKFNKDINICLYGNPHLKNDLKYPAYSPFMNNGVYRVLFGFNKSIQLFKPSLIHVSNFTPFVKICPTVVTVHDLCFKTYPDTFKKKSILAFNLFFKHSLDLADAIIAVSLSVKRNLIHYYDIDPAKIFVVYEAADPIFQYIKDKDKIRQMILNKFKIDKDYFLVVGDVDKRKNPLGIINSFQGFLNKDMQLVFVGPNKMTDAIQPKYASIIKLGKIQFLDYASDQDLNYLYNGASALIFNSLCEGFGLPIVESMSCETPVICSDIPVFREIASNAAIFVKNETELSNAISQITSSSSLRKKYVGLGYQRNKLFSWDKTAKQTLEVYKWVLESKKSSLSK